jgi:lipid-A-disaccharide synthase
LINIVAGDMVAPELIQDQCTAENAAERCLRILRDPDEIARIRYQLSRVKDKLGGAGASRRAAEVIYDMCVKSESAPVSGY